MKPAVVHTNLPTSNGVPMHDANSLPKALTAKEIWKSREDESKKTSSRTTERKPPIMLPKHDPVVNVSTDTIDKPISARMKGLDTSKMMNQYTGTIPPQLMKKSTTVSIESTEQKKDTDNSSDMRYLTMNRPSIPTKVDVTEDGRDRRSSSTSGRRNPSRKAFISDEQTTIVPTEQSTTNAPTQATLIRTKSLMPPSKSDISKLLDKKRRSDPIGLMKAQSTNSLETFLADDLRASGFDPSCVSFGAPSKV